MICTWKQWTSANTLEENHFICYMEQPTYTLHPKWWPCFLYRTVFSFNLIIILDEFFLDLRMCWLFRAKNTIKIRSKKSHVDHGGKWHIAAYWCSFTTKFKKQKSLLSSQHSQKYEKQNTKGVIMYIKRKEHVLSLGFSTIIYCTNLWQTFA